MSTALATFAHADDKKPEVPQCLEEKIQIEQLKQVNASLQAQMMQMQFPQVQESGQKAKTEMERLKNLLPKSKQAAPPSSPKGEQ